MNLKYFIPRVPRSLFTELFSLVAFSFFASCATSNAASPVWTNAATTEWNTASNWSSNSVPIAGETTEIDVVTGNMPVISTTDAFTGGIIIGNWRINTTGTSTLTIQNGRKLTSGGTGTIGQQKNGLVTVTGAGSEWSLAGLQVLRGSLLIENGGKVSNTLMNFGGLVNQPASVSISGTSTLVSTGNWNMGGFGTMTITEASTASTASFIIGDAASSNVSVLVTGTGTTLKNNTYMGRVGLSGTGSLTITNGATVEWITTYPGYSELNLGGNASGNGTLNIGNGAGAGTIIATVITGGAGTGRVVFNHTDSAYTLIPQITGTVSVSHNGSGTTILNKASTYAGTTTVATGRLVGDSNTAFGTSAVTVTGGAVVINTARTMTNAFTLNGGTLEVRGTLASGGSLVFGAAGGTLSGTGTIAKALTLTDANQILSPGLSAGFQTYSANQAWNAMTYKFELNSWTGTVAGTDFDQINIVGGLDLSGASIGSLILDLTSLTAGNVPGSLLGFSEIDRSWTIATTTTGIIGFSAANWQTLADNFSPSFGGTFALSAVGNDLVLSYTAVPEPGSMAFLAVGVALCAVCARQSVRKLKVS